MLTLPGCSTLKFLVQAGQGQLMLLNRGVPIEQIVEDERKDPRLRALLSKIPEIRTFGEGEGLKATRNYRQYVELEGDAVVHVVTASEALEFKPEVFSFPWVGSFTYLGWFNRKDAETFASGYRERGLDVDIRGAAAYSTLGWFPDPLLSTMIPRSREGRFDPEGLPDLVNLFLHESVHATLYIHGQSAFNESLADFLAGVLTERYFLRKGKEEAAVWKRYSDRLKDSQGRRILLERAYRELDALYHSDQSEALKRTKKKEILDALQKNTGIRRELNNASLIQFKTYDSGERGFRELFNRNGQDVRQFLSRLASLRSSDFKSAQAEEFREVLDRLQ